MRASSRCVEIGGGGERSAPGQRLEIEGLETREGLRTQLRARGELRKPLRGFRPPLGGVGAGDEGPGLGVLEYVANALGLLGHVDGHDDRADLEGREVDDHRFGLVHEQRGEAIPLREAEALPHEARCGVDTIAHPRVGDLFPARAGVVTVGDEVGTLAARFALPVDHLAQVTEGKLGLVEREAAAGLGLCDAREGLGIGVLLGRGQGSGSAGMFPVGRGPMLTAGVPKCKAFLYLERPHYPSSPGRFSEGDSV